MDTPHLALHPPLPCLPASPQPAPHMLALPKLVSAAYDTATPTMRARLLECLLRPMRPLGLVAVAAGAFSGFLHRQHWRRLRIEADDTARFTGEQVAQLARFVAQVQPEAFQQMADLLADNPAFVQTLSGALLLVSLNRWLGDQAPTAAL